MRELDLNSGLCRSMKKVQRFLLRERLCAGTFKILVIDTSQTTCRTQAQQCIANPKHITHHRITMINHNPELSARLEHSKYFLGTSDSIRTMMDYSPGINHVEEPF